MYDGSGSGSSHSNVCIFLTIINIIFYWKVNIVFIIIIIIF